MQIKGKINEMQKLVEPMSSRLALQGPMKAIHMAGATQPGKTQVLHA